MLRSLSPETRRPDTQRSWWYITSLSAKTRESGAPPNPSCVRIRRQGKTKSLPLEIDKPRETFLLYGLFFPTQAFSELDEVHPHWRGKPTLLNLLIQMFTSSRNTLTDTLRIMFNQISRHSMALSSWQTKLNFILGFANIRFFMTLHFSKSISN